MPIIATIFGSVLELVDEAGELVPMPAPVLLAIHEAEVRELADKLLELAGVTTDTDPEYDA